MTVQELTRDQIEQLKQSYLTEHNERVSYDELSNADELVSDETIFEEYAGVIFSEDDF